MNTDEQEIVEVPEANVSSESPPMPEGQAEIVEDVSQTPASRQRMNKNIEIKVEDDQITEEEKFYIGGLFSIETSPAFKSLESVTKGKNSTLER
jgi:hypothetical protein